jgi:subtilisin family serine protease
VAGFEACSGGRSYIFLDGTSPSAAHVSGEAAVIEAELPGDQTPAQLTACILETADPLPDPALSANGRINVLAGQACGAASVAAK